MAIAIEAKGLLKRFRDQVALNDLSFAVEEGTVLGVLGPNGAGKTTAVRAVTGLHGLDAGKAWIFGHDVHREAAAVKQMTGLSGQFAAVDGDLTTVENLVLVARLYGLPKRAARERAQQLIVDFDMGSYQRKPVNQHSGGMRRRLDLACALVGRPRVLVLDEPTTGLDPKSRLSLWVMIQGLVRDGTTLLLTTQYLDEADFLADQILVVDGGREVAKGSPQQLKERLGGDRVVIELADPRRDAVLAVDVLHQTGAAVRPRYVEDSGEVVLQVRDASRKLAACVGALSAANISIASISVKEPTLDEVFFALTGGPATSTAASDGSAQKVA